MNSSEEVKLSEIGITSLPPCTSDPIDLAKTLIENFRKQNPYVLVTFNLATVNEENGVLGRTMEFAGFSDNGGILVGTDRNSRKYKDILKNPNVALTFIFVVKVNGVDVYQQIRVNGIAEECTRTEIEAYWEKQPAFAKVRSEIHSQKSKMRDIEDFRANYQRLVNECERGKLIVPIPDQTTCLKVMPKSIDFYQSSFNCVADGYIYIKKDNEWTVKHFYG